MREASTWITLSVHFPPQPPAHLFLSHLLCQNQMVHSLPSYLQRCFLIVGVCSCTVRARYVTHHPSIIKRRMRTFIHKRIPACISLHPVDFSKGNCWGWMCLICSDLDHLQGGLTTRLESFDIPRSGAKWFFSNDSVKGEGGLKLDEGQGKDSSYPYFFVNWCLHSA